MKILSWNVRGVNDPYECRRISELICNVRPNWVGFQETKLREVLNHIIGQLFGFQDMGYAFFPSNDLVSSLLCCWNCAHFSKSSKVCQPRLIAVKGSWITGDGLEGLIYIYALTEYSVRVVVFQSVISFVNNWVCSDFIIFGDFNWVLRGEKQCGDLQGSSFTFFGNNQNMACTMIDRFLISDGARSCFLISIRKLLSVLFPIIFLSLPWLETYNQVVCLLNFLTSVAKIPSLVVWLRIILGRVYLHLKVHYRIGSTRSRWK